MSLRPQTLLTALSLFGAAGSLQAFPISISETELGLPMVAVLLALIAIRPKPGHKKHS